MIMMVTLTAHNFPEGLAVSVSSLESESLGSVVTIAIALHNSECSSMYASYYLGGYIFYQDILGTSS